jgi:hypothetical protein
MLFRTESEDRFQAPLTTACKSQGAPQRRLRLDASGPNRRHEATYQYIPNLFARVRDFPLFAHTVRLPFLYWSGLVTNSVSENGGRLNDRKVGTLLCSASSHQQRAFFEKFVASVCTNA